VKVPFDILQEMPDIEGVHPHAILFGQSGSMILVRKPAACGQLKRLYEQEPVLLLFFGHKCFLLLCLGTYQLPGLIQGLL
jgi:hypothetical protein